MAKEKNNLKDMSEDDLQKELDILQETIRVLKFKAEGSRSKNIKESSTLKKEVARIMTAMNNVKKKAVKG